MDRAFTLNAPPEAVWPSVVPARDAACGMVSTEAVERFVPRRRRAVRSLNVTWRSLVVGDVIPNYGGRGETFEVAAIEAPSTLVYDRPRKNERQLVDHPDVDADAGVDGRPSKQTRIHLRLGLAPVRRPWLAESGGAVIGLLTVAGMAA